MTRMDDRHRTDAVTIGDTRTLRTTSRGRLAHLGDLAHVQIADGEPDLRGWEVKGPAGRRVGTVSDLLVDTGAMKVRYLEVELDPPTAREMAHASGDTDPRIKASRHALVPIWTCSHGSCGRPGRFAVDSLLRLVLVAACVHRGHFTGLHWSALAY